MHISSLVTVLGAQFMVLAVIHVTAVGRNEELRFLRWVGMSFALLGLGMFMLLNKPDAFMSESGFRSWDTLILLGVLCHWCGVRVFHGKSPFCRAMVAISLLALVLFLCSRLFGFTGRLAWTATGLALFGGSIEVLRTDNREARAWHLSLGVTAVFGGLGCFALVMEGLTRSGPALPSMVALPMMLSWGALALVIGILAIIAGKDRIVARLHTMANTDSLTGLPNRRAFFDRIDLGNTSPVADGEYNAMMLIDIDHFKAINDRYGHIEGDAVLGRFAALVRQWAGEGAVLCRFGGEEFAVMLTQPSEEAALRKAESLRHATATGLKAGDDLITISIGLAVAEPFACSPQRLLVLADKALYTAKAAGRNRTVKAAMTRINGLTDGPSHTTRAA